MSAPRASKPRATSSRPTVFKSSREGVKSRRTIWNFGTSRLPMRARTRRSANRTRARRGPWTLLSREARPALELRVGRQRVGAKARVVGERAEGVLGILRPALDPDVDLADRPKAVA